MSKEPLKPNIDEWPSGMNRKWTEAAILAMRRSRDEVLARYEATGEPVHFFPGIQCPICQHVAPWLVESDSCTVCKYYENQRRKAPPGTPARVKARHEKMKALGFGPKGMSGGGSGYKALIPPPHCGIARSDDDETNKARRSARPEDWVTDHIVHAGHAAWPLPKGVYIVGLEVAQNLQHLTQWLNRRKGSRLPDPTDFRRGVNQPLGIEEQAEFVRKRMAIWISDLVWENGVPGTRLERINWDPYELDTGTGDVIYSGDKPTELAEAAE